MADIAQATPLPDLRQSYMAQVRQRRLYSGIALLVFVVIMVSGFNLAASRNGGSFWGGIDNFFDYPAEVVAEAASKVTELPAHFATYFPALVETVNIAAVSTLVGCLLGGFFALYGTRGLARFPSLEDAEKCYYSDAYQAALSHAKGAAERDLMIVEEIES